MPLSLRLYRSLLVIYPEPFRSRFAPEMTQLFADCCREYWQESRWLGMATLWAYTAGELSYAIWTYHLAPRLHPAPLLAVPVAALLFLPLLWFVEPGLSYVKQKPAAATHPSAFHPPGR